MVVVLPLQIKEKHPKLLLAWKSHSLANCSFVVKNQTFNIFSFLITSTVTWRPCWTTPSWFPTTRGRGPSTSTTSSWLYRSRLSWRLLFSIIILFLFNKVKFFIFVTINCCSMFILLHSLNQANIRSSIQKQICTIVSTLGKFEKTTLNWTSN